jgi:MscS family membrane protein
MLTLGPIMRRLKLAVQSLGILAICACYLLPAHAQVPVGAPTPPETKTEEPKDALGRDSPRGTVLGFLAAARKGTSVAALYLDTPLRGPDAEELAHQLAVVLDARLPARLNELSDKAEGSIPNPLKPNEDLVGTINTANGHLDIVVERVDRGKIGRVWLFSSKTLHAIPDVYAELNSPPIEKVLPAFLTKRVAAVPVFHWLAFFVGLPLVYLLTGLLNRIVGFALAIFSRLLGRNQTGNPLVIPAPLRLLIVAFVIRWALSNLGLPLLARQFWSTTALFFTIIASIWMLMLLNGWGERFLISRRPDLTGSGAVLRLVRRVFDGIILFAALLFTLYHFGVSPTAALAGAGVGGIAIALAAQKTLENLIAGVSLIADKAVHVGDFLKIGDTVGTIEQVGLRSTRIRTLDRTVVCLPNGQISNMSLESFSVRDKFWFHPRLNLRFETNPSQMRTALSELRNMLLTHSRVEASSVRVRFIAIAQSSFDVEIFAYIFASDWGHFLEIQEQILLTIVDIVQNAGAEFAFPSQTMYLSADSKDGSSPLHQKLAAGSERTELSVVKGPTVKH